MIQSSDTIPVFEAVEITAAPAKRGGRAIRVRGHERRAVEVVEHSVDLLRDNMARFIDAINGMLADCAGTTGGFEMDTVEVNAQIGAGGKIGFLGTGMNVEGSSSLTVVLKRRSS